MDVDHTNLIRALILLNLPGVLCGVWDVKYQQQDICAVKGSSVVILCSYYYDIDMRVRRVMWGHKRQNIYNGPFVFDSNSINASTKFQYIGDKSHNCSLKIHQVEHSDSGKYHFRIVTNTEKWTTPIGATLHVVDLNISVTPNGAETMKEGESVDLTCVDGCDGGSHSSAIVWFKDGEPLHEGPVLHMSNMSSKSSGNYACSLKQHTGTRSEVRSIDVEYAPKNTSISVRPSTEVDLGTDIILICSSHAKPPVEEYTWFAVDGDVVKALEQQRELHLNCLVSGCGGSYFCSAANIHGSQNSSVVTFKVKEDEATIIRNILISVIIAMLLLLAIGITIKRLNKSRLKPPNTENTQNTPIYANWSMIEYNQSQEGGQREAELLEIIYSSVKITTKTTAERQTDAHSGDDCPVIYSRVFSNQLFHSSCIQPRSL